jgi:hypothetical protein
MGSVVEKKASLVMPTLVLAALICAYSTALSQTMPDSTVPRFKVNSRLVLVDVIAEYMKDELHGRPITLATELQREDFRVFDNGKEMPISSFDIGIEHTTRPIALWLIVQCPEGHAEGWSSDFLRGRTGLIKPALTHLEMQDAVGVAHWCDNGEALIDLPPGHDPDASTAALDHLLSQRPVRGENRTGELAMQKLIRLLVDEVQHSKPDRLPILLFLYGDHCATYPDEAEKIIEAVLEASGFVFGMSDANWQVNPGKDHNGYGQINYLVHHYSRETGGEYYTTVDPKLFSAAVDYIITQLHLRYTIGFKPLLIDGKKHKVKVELTKESQQRLLGMQLRFRQEYIPVAGDPR